MGTISEYRVNKVTRYNPLPFQPCDENEPVFDEPWHAQAFALAVHLSESGVFSWREWTEAITKEIMNAGDLEQANVENTYYKHWVYALEKIIKQKNIISNKELKIKLEEWRMAYLNTPHGNPVTL